MGTTAEVQVAGLANPGPAQDAAFAALSRVDAALTLWQPSELTRLNESGRASVSPDLLAVLRHAIEVARESAGAFDPTIEPLVRACGGLGGPRRQVGDAELKLLLARVGVARVHLDAATADVWLAPGTRLDFGGIAKGYAVDLALAALRDAGASSGLVDLGTSSLGVFGQPLRVEVRDPEGGAPWASFMLVDGALATSGGDQRPDHILDPRSGRPARQVLAATVLARSGIEADALSTAAFVLGARAGLALVERRGAEGLVLRREGQRRVLYATRGFAAARQLATRPGILVRD